MGLFIYGVFMDCASIGSFVATNNTILCSDGFEGIYKKIILS